MTPRIRLLHRLLANQIAAGEVIERPASVVKELLENSIDAGATQIDVEIQDGGLRLIKVRDNGCGIHKEDLHLAISRHATSKISRIEDLTSIQSLGFRGEALASIAAVTRFWLSSKPAEQEQAWQIHGNGVEDEIKAQPTSHPNGTTIMAQDLFFNTPVRRKFIRSQKTEYLQIEEVFKRIALSHFNIGFSLTCNERPVHRLLPATTAPQQQRRVAKIFGRNFLEQSSFIDVEATGLALAGWLGMPSLTRSQNDLQYIYLNGRLVRDKVINHALRRAYADLLPEGRQALYALYLNVDPQLVDVNVHPTKHEVRFQESRLIHGFLVNALRKSLQQMPVLSPDTATVSPRTSCGVRSEHLDPDQTPQQVRGDNIGEQGYKVEEPSAEYQIPVQNSWGKIVSMLQQRWLLTETATGILLIDSHMAWRNLLVEELLQAYTQGTLTSQPLLFPYSHTATEEMISKLAEHCEALQAVGIGLDQIAPTAVVLRSMPHLLNNVDSKKFLLLLTDQIKRKYGQLEINEIFALVAFAEQLTGLISKEQLQILLEKLHLQCPLQLPSIPTFCKYLNYV